MSKSFKERLLRDDCYRLVWTYLIIDNDRES